MAPAKSRNDPSDYAAEIGPKGFREIRTGQRHLDRGLQEPQLVPGVEAAAGEAHGVDGSPFAQAFERVGDLDLSPVVGRGLAEDGEDVRRQHVSADYREVRR